MQKFARVVDGIVAEVFTPPTGFTIQECFTPQIVALFEPCPSEVMEMWLKKPDGTFEAPPQPPATDTPTDTPTG